MKQKKFLGTVYPKKPVPVEATGAHLSHWMLYLAFPLVIAATILYVLFTSTHTPTINSNSPLSDTVQVRSLGAVPYSTLASNHTPPKSATVKSTNSTKPRTTIECSVAFGNESGEGKLDANQVFPLIPEALLPSGQCPPTQWTLDVVRYFAYKGLTIANWLAITLAVLLTVWGGLLYISGFASEANVKKAKTIIIGAYIGLIIVILARTILFGSIQTTLKNNYNSGQLPNKATEYIK